MVVDEIQGMLLLMLVLMLPLDVAVFCAGEVCEPLVSSGGCHEFM